VSAPALVIYRVFHKPQQAPDKFGLYWDFVKTNEKPYDELVVAVLVSFRHHFPAAAFPRTGPRATGRAASPSMSGALVGRRRASASWPYRGRRP